MAIRIEDTTALGTGLFDAPTVQETGTSDPTQFQAPTQSVDDTSSGLSVEHLSTDRNRGAGIRL